MVNLKHTWPIVASVLLAACSRREPAPTAEPAGPAAPVAPAAPPPQAPAPVAAAQTATIAAPNNPNGSPRRGIVRAAPDFKAAEVARLDNGTTITVVSELHGGWLQVQWSGGAGYLHRDVVKR